MTFDEAIGFVNCVKSAKQISVRVENLKPNSDNCSFGIEFLNTLNR